MKRFKNWLIHKLGGVDKKEVDDAISAAQNYRGLYYGLMKLREEEYKIIPIKSFLMKRRYLGVYPDNPSELMMKQISNDLATYILHHGLVEVEEDNESITVTLRIAVKSNQNTYSRTSKNEI